MLRRRFGPGAGQDYGGDGGESKAVSAHSASLCGGLTGARWNRRRRIWSRFSRLYGPSCPLRTRGSIQYMLGERSPTCLVLQVADTFHCPLSEQRSYTVEYRRQCSDQLVGAQAKLYARENVNAFARDQEPSDVGPSSKCMNPASYPQRYSPP